jgi:hypothetical protein
MLPIVDYAQRRQQGIQEEVQNMPTAAFASWS